MFASCIVLAFFAFFKELSSTTMTREPSRSEQLLIVPQEGVSMKIAAHCIRIFVSYAEMLIIMTFNMFIILALLSGHGFGIWYKQSYWELDTVLLEENR